MAEEEEATGAGGEQRRREEAAAAEAMPSLFEVVHAELVEAAWELAASCGADVTVVVLPPARSSGAPPLGSHFGGALLERELPAHTEEEIARMGWDEVAALERRLTALRQLLLWRMEVSGTETPRRRPPPAAAADQQPPAKRPR